MTGGGQDPVSPNGIKRSHTHPRGSTCLSIPAPAGLGMAPCPAHTASSVSAPRCPYSAPRQRREAVVTPPPPRPFLQSLGTASHSIPPPRLSPDGKKNEEKQARLGVAGPHCAGRAQSCICRAHTDGGGSGLRPALYVDDVTPGCAPRRRRGLRGPDWVRSWQWSHSWLARAGT